MLFCRMGFIKSIRGLSSRVVVSFFIGMTLLIIIFNDALGDEDSFIILSLCFFVIMFVVLTRLIFKQIINVLNLKKEKKQTELMHLKSQVNPHFFFNTLNNLYGLVGQDVDKAQKLILKLSDMMRYSIYEGQNDVVTLAEEIEYLDNYIELHRMRYHKEINVRFDKNVLDPEVEVMPLLFIIILENAFKHGVEDLVDNAFVDIRLSASMNDIQCIIENNFDQEIRKDKGIGLDNLTRRLELVYPNKHKLITSKNGDTFRAELNIQL